MRSPLRALENLSKSNASYYDCTLNENNSTLNSTRNSLDSGIIVRYSSPSTNSTISTDENLAINRSSIPRLIVGDFEDGVFVLPNECKDDGLDLDQNDARFVNNENQSTPTYTYSSPEPVLHTNLINKMPVFTLLSVNQIYRRTLSFKNLIIGDERLGIINPVLLDPDRETYVKTIDKARIQNVLHFVLTTRFINVRNIIFHVGSNDLNKDFLSVFDVAKRIQLLIKCSELFSPRTMIYFSLPLPVFEEESSQTRTSLLHLELVKLCKPINNVAILKHSNIIRQNGKCMYDRGQKFTTNPTDNVFIRNFRSILGIEDGHQVVLDL